MQHDHTHTHTRTHLEEYASQLTSPEYSHSRGNARLYILYSIVRAQNTPLPYILPTPILLTVNLGEEHSSYLHTVCTRMEISKVSPKTNSENLKLDFI